MSYEAVPCMFRSTNGAEPEYLGLIIRKAEATANSSQASTGNGNGRAGAPPAPLRVQGVYRPGAPITVSGENASTLLVPANLQVRLAGSDMAASAATFASSWQQTPVRMNAHFSSPNQQLNSPLSSQNRSLSVCSSSPQTESSPLSPTAPALYSHNNQTKTFRIQASSDVRSGASSGMTNWPVSAGSSTTPDSGIQSVPGSPPITQPLTPPTMEACSSVCEDVPDEEEEEEDFADMPRLIPVDQETTAEDTECQPGPSGLRDESLSAHGSECETATPAAGVAPPTLSINPGMDSNAIVEQLLKFDPEKASAIAKLIRKKTAEQKRRSDSRLDQSPSSKKARPCSAASDEMRRSEEEGRGKDEVESVRSESGTATPSIGLVDTAVTTTVLTQQEADALREALARDHRSPKTILSSVSSLLKECQSPSSSHMTSSKRTKPVNATSSKSEEPMTSSPKQLNDSDARQHYRAAVRRMLEQKLEELVEKTNSELKELHIGERERHERRAVKKIWHIDWDAVRKRRRKEEEAKKRREKEGRRDADEQKKRREHAEKRDEKREARVKVEETERKVEPVVKKERKRRSGGCVEVAEGRETRRLSVSRASKRQTSECATEEGVPEKKRDMDYAEVPRSFCQTALPSACSWSCVQSRCGCTRGACTSDAECMNRALRVQCPKDCQAALCVNKKFWKEDMVRQLSASGPRTKKVLRTKHTRRAGEFLGEYAGEVVSFAEAVRRNEDYGKREEQPRILSLSASLFVDATLRGNIARYVRHSCRPNARLEVWSIRGNMRAGLFSLFDIASGSEVTIDMNCLLPVGRACNCSLPECRNNIKASRNATLSSAPALSLAEEKITRQTRVFLMRTRSKTISRASSRYLAENCDVPQSSIDCFKKVLEGMQIRIRRIDGSLPYAAIRGYTAMRNTVAYIEREKLEHEKALEVFQVATEQLLEDLDDDDYDRAYSALCTHYLSHLSQQVDPKNEKKKDGRATKREMDLGYLESKVKVNSYDPDAAWPTGKAKEGDDAVRCECGSVEEDGEMLQCDSCHFWLHSDCIDHVDPDTDYQCQFCRGTIKGAPCNDVMLAKQPEIKLHGCSYYKALNNRRCIQVRLNETVYVEMTSGDEHKKILKRLAENSEKKKGKEGDEKHRKTSSAVSNREKIPKKEFNRKDLRIFRVERLFVEPSGHRFVFGFYYARPHETICDSQRIFHKNEVFATPFYDTLPLDSVVGRCFVLDQENWAKGRPTVPLFKEMDVFVCEYQIDRNQRCFERIPPRNRFPVNTQPYVFNLFKQPVPLHRDFTPFLSSDRCNSRTGSRTSRHESAREELGKQIAQSRIEHLVQRLALPSAPAIKAQRSKSPPPPKQTTKTQRSKSDSRRKSSSSR